MRCMHNNGRGCWAGVRHIAELTGMNKNSVGKYRKLAIELGWLVRAPPDEARHRGELWASVPDTVPIEPRFVSALVLRDGTHRPTALDRSPHNSLTPNERYIPDGKTEGLSKESAELVKKRTIQLHVWLASDVTARSYRGDSDSLMRLTPDRLRFTNYGNVIRDFEEALGGEPGRDQR